ncbi:endonuclease/exonuclease/phosphatase family protein [Streptomyces sp. 6N223]|uniref:endonuclease/exonuclease/phosphatase family protein n=1 Tax=Streptomyces sp. 6N223 TaxID=3457412 RepID=UPI003FCF7449
MRDDTAALARVIRACAPDVLCVQEAPRFFRWRQHAARLGRATGLTYVSGGAPSCGTMIMSTLRPAVEHAEDVTFPLTRGLHRRGLAMAVLRFGSGGPPGNGGVAAGGGADAARLGVISCHLSLQRAERYEQGRLLLRHLDALGAPAAVVAGDINERPGGRTFRMLAGRLTDAWAAAPEGGEFTSTASEPHQRIDAVFCTPSVEVVGCGVPAALPGLDPADLRRATDHLPVLATLRV